MFGMIRNVDFCVQPQKMNDDWPKPSHALWIDSIRFVSLLTIESSSLDWMTNNNNCPLFMVDGRKSKICIKYGHIIQLHGIPLVYPQDCCRASQAHRYKLICVKIMASRRSRPSRNITMDVAGKVHMHWPLLVATPTKRTNETDQPFIDKQ